MLQPCLWSNFGVQEKPIEHEIENFLQCAISLRRLPDIAKFSKNANFLDGLFSTNYSSLKSWDVCRVVFAKQKLGSNSSSETVAEMRATIKEPKV